MLCFLRGLKRGYALATCALTYTRLDNLCCLSKEFRHLTPASSWAHRKASSDLGGLVIGMHFRVNGFLFLRYPYDVAGPSSFHALCHGRAFRTLSAMFKNAISSNERAIRRPPTSMTR